MIEEDIKIFSLPDLSGCLCKEKYLKKVYPDLYERILENNNEEIPFNEKFTLYKKGLKDIPLCLECGDKVSFINSNLGWKTYCSLKCSNSSILTKNKKKETGLKNWGLEHPQQSNIVKEKAKKTCNILYGGNSCMSSDIIREKSKNTLIKRKEENPELYQKMINNRVEKFKKSNYKENYKKSNMKVYGVEYPMQNEEIKLRSHLNKEEGMNSMVRNKLSELEIIEIKRPTLNKELKYTTISALCDKGHQHIFECSYDTIANRKKRNQPLCTTCFPISETDSFFEKEIGDFIIELGFDIERNNKTIIKPSELDIFIYDKNIAIECNGLYWHSSQFKKSNYHQQKMLKCFKKGIILIQIWEDDWNNNKLDIKEKLRNILLLNKFPNTNNLEWGIYNENMKISKPNRYFIKNEERYRYVPKNWEYKIYDSGFLIS